MRLRLRLLYLILSSLWRSKMSFSDESVLSFTAFPHDIDITKVTNDRFIAFMDLGRMDIAFRVGLLKIMIKRKWIPLATFATIRFRHYLSVFQKFRLHTRIIYWDKETFYFEQLFKRNNRIVATGYVCATCLSKEDPVCPDEIIASTGQDVDRPDMPTIVLKLQKLEEDIHNYQKKSD